MGFPGDGVYLTGSEISFQTVLVCSVCRDGQRHGILTSVDHTEASLESCCLPYGQHIQPNVTDSGYKVLNTRQITLLNDFEVGNLVLTSDITVCNRSFLGSAGGTAQAAGYVGGT